MYNIKHLEGRYSYDPDIDKIWGHFEDGFLEEVDGEVELRAHASGQATLKFKDYIEKKGGGVSGTSVIKIPSSELEYYDSKAKVYKKIDRGKNDKKN